MPSLWSRLFGLEAPVGRRFYFTAGVSLMLLKYAVGCGEFRLVALDGGRTRLEGSTWYELSMHPQAYWTLWSDALIHSVHLRVLRHIRSLSEADAR